jgi:hypothetical protein
MRGRGEGGGWRGGMGGEGSEGKGRKGGEGRGGKERGGKGRKGEGRGGNWVRSGSFSFTKSSCRFIINKLQNLLLFCYVVSNNVVNHFIEIKLLIHLLTDSSGVKFQVSYI